MKKMETLNYNIPNELHIACQMVAIVGWIVLYRHLIEKKDYLKKRIFWLLTFAISSMTISSLSDLLNSDFMLDWSLLDWYYPTNYALILSFYFLINEIENTKDCAVKFYNSKNKLRDENN